MAPRACCSCRAIPATRFSGTESKRATPDSCRSRFRSTHSRRKFGKRFLRGSRGSQGSRGSRGSRTLKPFEPFEPFEPLEPLEPLLYRQLPRPDAIALEHRNNKDPSVADLAGARRLDDRLDGVVGDVVLDDDLELHFREQVDVVLLAPIDGGMALLLAVSPDLGDGHAADAQLLQRIAHLIDFVRPDDTLDQLHRCLQACAAGRRGAPAVRNPSVSLRPS